jgi:hypothetical protein
MLNRTTDTTVRDKLLLNVANMILNSTFGQPIHFIALNVNKMTVNIRLSCQRALCWWIWLISQAFWLKMMSRFDSTWLCHVVRISKLQNSYLWLSDMKNILKSKFKTLYQTVYQGFLKKGVWLNVAAFTKRENAIYLLECQ